jgi:hypothetical protein
MRKKFSTKNVLTTSKKLAAAGRAAEKRYDAWIGRLRKRVQRNEQSLRTTKQRVRALEIKLKRLASRVP